MRKLEDFCPAFQTAFLHNRTIFPSFVQLPLVKLVRFFKKKQACESWTNPNPPAFVRTGGSIGRQRRGCGRATCSEARGR